MGNSNFLKDLEEYFKNTSKEQIMIDWSESEKFDQVGPTVGEFLKHNFNERVDIDLLLDKLKEDYKEGRVRDWVQLSDWISMNLKHKRFDKVSKGDITSILYESFANIRDKYNL